MKLGKVHLVGAGPGDPGLITVRGAQLLALADVVVYDYLSNPLLLKHAPQAEHRYVGKKAAAHSFTQDQINQLLIDQARLGKTVVRLKGGDPFVFGRGGEECEALFEAGIAFDVVPGITAAIGAPAYAGIPVTHRDFNSSFTFVTGHEKEEQYKDDEARTRKPGEAESDLDWSVLAKLPCVAFYMGVKSLPRIATRLIEHGMKADTPAAVIRWGTMPTQKTVVGTLQDIAQKVAEAKIAPPAMTIVGKVVSMREKIEWFESRPLFGQTIVVTRSREGASEMAGGLAELGANVIEAPTIEIGPSENSELIDASLKSIANYDWIVFTSANGVKETANRLRSLSLDSRAFGTAKIAAIGAATAEAVRDVLFLRVDLCPERFVAEALADEFAKQNEIAGKRFLLLRADIARPILVERLQAGKADEVKDVPIYETRPATELPQACVDAIEKHAVDWITFTSSSTAKNLVGLLGEEYREKLKGVKLASIGPVTSQTLRDLGLEPTIQSETFDVPHLVEAIRKHRAT